MISHRLTLDYAIAPGWMLDYVEGLRTGQAIARRCDDCRRVSFPPLRICDCGSDRGDWEKLSGEACITHRTDGSDGSFALVRFAGVDTHSVVRLLDVPPNCTSGILAPATCETPQLCLIPTPRLETP